MGGARVTIMPPRSSPTPTSATAWKKTGPACRPGHPDESRQAERRHQVDGSVRDAPEQGQARPQMPHHEARQQRPDARAQRDLEPGDGKRRGRRRARRGRSPNRAPRSQWRRRERYHHAQARRHGRDHVLRPHQPDDVALFQDHAGAIGTCSPPLRTCTQIDPARPILPGDLGEAGAKRARILDQHVDRRHGQSSSSRSSTSSARAPIMLDDASRGGRNGQHVPGLQDADPVGPAGAPRRAGSAGGTAGARLRRSSACATVRPASRRTLLAGDRRGSSKFLHAEATPEPGRWIRVTLERQRSCAGRSPSAGRPRCRNTITRRCRKCSRRRPPPRYARRSGPGRPPGSPAR